ncbi:MAG: hypothetical protein AB8G14_07220 [Ilumatobacter sp.]
MEFASTVEFAHAARRLTRAATRQQLLGPSFRCPPRLVGVDRTIRRRTEAEGGGAVVSIRVKGRPREAVLADMIEGVVATNRLVTPDADRVRNELWQTMQAAPSAEVSNVSRGAA